ncbi:chaplin ChpF [Streptomyces hebeiensis]|uniref:Chaplin ChpF n=1 Tax=Streptomyces hebeiensis TaxID=229486 RepID=A0ABN1V0Q6_9ACTN|nr:chaplin [Streptomyces sp. NRRL F-5135]
MSRIAKAVVLSTAAVATVAGASGSAFADSGANAAAIGSPGVISGNVIQVPLHVPINLCGNTIDIIGLLNPAFGNVCLNH